MQLPKLNLARLTEDYMDSSSKEKNSVS